MLGGRFGNVFVGVQPAFGYEGDPMRLLFEKGFAPTHAFSRLLSLPARGLRGHAVLHFGTHGALEFMPGKQAGMSADCWPDRLIGDLPNFYLYAANNPSEGTIASAASAATLVSYLTPPGRARRPVSGPARSEGFARPSWRALGRRGEGPSASDSPR